jgi:hypothetical protein
MVRSISDDIRKRSVAAVAKGETCRSVASRFGVAVSSVVKRSQRHRATGSVSPGKMGGRHKPVLELHRDFISELLSSGLPRSPDGDQQGVGDQLGRHGRRSSSRSPPGETRLITADT